MAGFTSHRKFIHSYEEWSNRLHRTNVVTGEKSWYELQHLFMSNSILSELPGGSLLVTGGGFNHSKDLVTRIDVLRDFAALTEPHMLASRQSHCAVYHALHLYTLGGWDIFDLGACERYVCTERRWEEIAPLPIACHSTTGIEIEESLYVLGGKGDNSCLDCIQKLSLHRLTWELLQLRLPFTGLCIPCFKDSDFQVYLVVNGALYSFQPDALLIQLIKTLPQNIQSSTGLSYFSRGTLYCSCEEGETLELEIGEA